MITSERAILEVDLNNVLGEAFQESHRAIKNRTVHTVVEEGGRGSLKSSFCSVEDRKSVV